MDGFALDRWIHAEFAVETPVVEPVDVLDSRDLQVPMPRHGPSLRISSALKIDLPPAARAAFAIEAPSKPWVANSRATRLEFSGGPPANFALKPLARLASTPDDMRMVSQLRVALAAPIKAEHVDLLRDLEPRLEVHYEPAALPPMRFPADFSGDPSYARSEDVAAWWGNELRSADALFGVPDVAPALLAEVVRENFRLRWVHTMAAGGGGQVRAAALSPAELERVQFTTSAGVHGTSLAEFAVFGIVAGAKDLPRLVADQTAKRWPDRWVMRPVNGSTVLVLGLGGIGAEVARLCAGLGMHVIGVSRSGRPVPHVDELVTTDEIQSVLPRVNAIVSTLPGTASTEGLLGQSFFSGVQPGTTFVNVGRGTVVDESALVDALRDGRVGFAALDVVAVEPLPAESALWTLPQVLISPHTAALTEAEEERIVRLFAENATRLLGGLPLRNVVNTVEFY